MWTDELRRREGGSQFGDRHPAGSGGDDAVDRVGGHVLRAHLGAEPGTHVDRLERLTAEREVDVVGAFEAERGQVDVAVEVGGEPRPSVDVGGVGLIDPGALAGFDREATVTSIGVGVMIGWSCLSMRSIVMPTASATIVIDCGNPA